MKKSHYILFGSSSMSKSEIVSEFNNKIDLEFRLRDSLYRGKYFSYVGIYADLLTIEDNCVFGELKESSFENYRVLIYISITEGRNKDKLTRANHIKRLLLSYFNDVDYLREKVLLDDGSVHLEVSAEEIAQINDHARSIHFYRNGRDVN